MKLLPYVNTGSDEYGMGIKADITVTILAYLSISIHVSMLFLEIYNVYTFVYKQQKYKVFPVSLFYSIAIPSTILCIYLNLFIVPNEMYKTPILLILPSEFKICIGLSQILVIIELTIRVKQSTLILEQTNKGEEEDSDNTGVSEEILG